MAELQRTIVAETITETVFQVVRRLSAVARRRLAGHVCAPQPGSQLLSVAVVRLGRGTCRQRAPSPGRILLPGNRGAPAGWEALGGRASDEQGNRCPTLPSETRLSGPDVGYGPLNAVADGSRAWGWCQGVEVVRDPLDAPLGGPRHGQPAIRGIPCGSCVHLVFSETAVPSRSIAGPPCTAATHAHAGARLDNDGGCALRISLGG